MNRVAHYLQEHLLGEVTTRPAIRSYFANDGSVLRLPPAVVVYPRNEQDIRRTASFSWQLAQRGQTIPITARGGGSNTSGAAIGPGILMVFTAHMNKILNLDTKKRQIIVEPGASYDKIEQTLYTHGLFLPPYPASSAYATVGGGIAVNALGEKSVKYGVTGDYVKSLRVILANGEVIETGSLGKKELSRKMGQATLEGEIYRALDKLLEENHGFIEENRAKFTTIRNVAGYNIFGIKAKNDFDLTPLIIGSQGSLGLISEVSLNTVAHNPLSTLCLASLPELENLNELLPQIKKLAPSVFDIINLQAIELISQINPNQLSGVLDDRSSEIHLIIEFDDYKAGGRKKAVKSLGKIINKAGGHLVAYSDPNDKDKILKIRDSIATILNFPRGHSKAVPVAEDISLPADKIVEFMRQAYNIYKGIDLKPAAWGHIGDGVLRFQPMLDLSNLGDRQKLFKISDGLYGLAVGMGGSITGGAGDGRIRAPYLRLQYGERLYSLMQTVKKIFDPYGILNPGVKTASPEEVKALMRSDYSLNRHYEHLPRS